MDLSLGMWCYQCITSAQQCRGEGEQTRDKDSRLADAQHSDKAWGSHKGPGNSARTTHTEAHKKRTRVLHRYYTGRTQVLHR